MSSFVVPLGVLTAVFVSVALLERVKRLQYVPAPVRRPWFETDMAWYLVAALSAGLSTFLLRPVLVHLAVPGLSGFVAGLPDVWQLLVAVVLFDGVFFSVHVLLHRSEVLWNVHKVHHSSRHLDVLATTRTHAFEHLVRNVPAQLVLFAFGFSAPTIAVAVLVIGGFGALNHSNLRLPIRYFEALFITPRLHRIHHVPNTSMNNFATVFSFWDRARRSLVQADVPTTATLGVSGEVDGYPQSFPIAFREPARQIRAQRREASDRARTTTEFRPSDPLVSASKQDQAA